MTIERLSDDQIQELINEAELTHCGSITPTGDIHATHLLQRVNVELLLRIVKK